MASRFCFISISCILINMATWCRSGIWPSNKKHISCASIPWSASIPLVSCILKFSGSPDVVFLIWYIRYYKKKSQTNIRHYRKYTNMINYMIKNIFIVKIFIYVTSQQIECSLSIFLRENIFLQSQKMIETNVLKPSVWLLKSQIISLKLFRK